MVASTVKTTQVSSAEARPIVLVDGALNGGIKRVWVAELEVATTSIDEVGDVIQLLRLPADLRPIRITFKNDDLDGDASPALAVNLGLLRADTGAVVDVDAFASAAAFAQSASTGNTTLLNEALDVAKIGQPLWEIGGLSARPETDLILALTVTTPAATAAAGTLKVVVEGVVN